MCEQTLTYNVVLFEIFLDSLSHSPVEEAGEGEEGGWDGVGEQEEMPTLALERLAVH